MEGLEGLREIIKESFKLNKCRSDVFAFLILALLQCRTVNLVRLSAFGLGSAVGSSSRYRRLQRFFSGINLSSESIARFLFGQFFTDKISAYLIIDRTNWQIGQSNINIMMLSFLHQGVSIPLLWSLLAKKGSSNQDERRELLDRYLGCFGAKSIKAILGDREFIGSKWFQYLSENSIPFVVRIKSSAMVTNAQGKYVKVADLFRELKNSEFIELKGLRKIDGLRVRISASRSPEGNLLVVASKGVDEHSLIEIYKTRWKIEDMFGALKTKGFHFEDTKITNPDRISNMIAVLAIAQAWSYKIAQSLIDSGTQIKIKKHNRKAISIFRLGLDTITNALINSLTHLINSFIALLSPVYRLS